MGQVHLDRRGIGKERLEGGGVGETAWDSGVGVRCDFYRCSGAWPVGDDTPTTQRPASAPVVDVNVDAVACGHAVGIEQVVGAAIVAIVVVEALIWRFRGRGGYPRGARGLCQKG